MNLKWVGIMAWRDSRTNRRRLLLYISSIVFGIAALVAVGSLGQSLRRGVDNQAKTLLGADLSINSNRPFEGELEEFLSSIPGKRAGEISFESMAYFPRQGATRLVRVRAIEGDFPFYGVVETIPEDASRSLREGPYAIVDEGLMLQFDVRIGDVIKLGAVEFEIRGRLLSVPGEVASLGSIGPRVHIPASYVPATGLVRTGSRVRYSALFKLPDALDADQFAEGLGPEIKRLDLRVDTVEERKERLGRALDNLSRFLALVSFIALLLGGIGVGSSIHLYIKQRFNTVAVLRCVGATPQQTFAIYLTQAVVMGFAGALVGALLGVAVQRMLPGVLAGVIPADLELQVSVWAILEGLLVGLGVAFLFALIPLSRIRNVSPLLALRSDYEPRSLVRDPLVWVLYVVLFCSLLVFSLLLTTRPAVGLGFFGGVVLVFGLLAAVAKAIMMLSRRVIRILRRYEWRQGLANLYRPHNQTLVLILALGLGTFLIVTLYLTQLSLLERLSFIGRGNRPNLILFDIQNDQKEPLRALVLAQNLPVLQEVPIVTMRIGAINGRSAMQIRDDPEQRSERWALRREYRSTYRTELSNTESLVAGRFQAIAGLDRIEISVEEGIARDLGVWVGDEIEWDIQGVPVKTRVGSIREVDWRNFQTNFFILFPSGVLEDAPQSHVLVTRVDSPAQSAALQREAVREFPNVSIIDLSLVIQLLDTILDKVGFVTRFMAVFTIITGFIVLVGAIVSGKYQRTRECVLLRTLGASKGQIFRILMTEYLFLGLFAAAAGTVLAATASWAICEFLFEIETVIAVLPIVGAFLVVVSLTVLVGMLNSRGILDHPPLETLRAEA